MCLYELRNVKLVVCEHRFLSVIWYLEDEQRDGCVSWRLSPTHVVLALVCADHLSQQGLETQVWADRRSVIRLYS